MFQLLMMKNEITIKSLIEYFDLKYKDFLSKKLV